MTAVPYLEYSSEKLLRLKLMSSLLVEKLSWWQKISIFYQIGKNALLMGLMSPVTY